MLRTQISKRSRVWSVILLTISVLAVSCAEAPRAAHVETEEAVEAPVAAPVAVETPPAPTPAPDPIIVATADVEPHDGEPVPSEPVAVTPTVAEKPVAVPKTVSATKAVAAPKPVFKTRPKTRLAKKGYDRGRMLEQRARVQTQARKTDELGSEIEDLKATLLKRKLTQLRSLAQRNGWTKDKEPEGPLGRTWREWVKLEKQFGEQAR